MFAELVGKAVEMSAADLDGWVRELVVLQRRVAAELAAALAVGSARSDYEADGHGSMHAYVKATMNCSDAEASRWNRLAQLGDEEPAVADALLTGRVGLGQMDRLARAAQHRRAGHAFRDHAERLVDVAEHQSYGELCTAADRFEVLADVDGAHADDRAHIDDRCARVDAGRAGVYVAASGGDALQAAEMQAIFELARQDQFDSDCAERRALHGDDAQHASLPRSASQRGFDALHAIFIAYAAADGTERRPEPVVNIVVDASTAGEVLHRHGLVDEPDVFDRSSDGSGVESGVDRRRCETSSGTVVHPGRVMAAMISGHVRRVVVDSAGVVVDLGRSQRLFTGKARTAAQLLVRECAHLGCSVPATFCDIDHGVEHHAGGATDQANGCVLCGRHNRHKHRKRWRTRRDIRGRVRLVRADGSTVHAAGETEPEWPDDVVMPVHAARPVVHQPTLLPVG